VVQRAAPESGPGQRRCCGNHDNAGPPTPGTAGRAEEEEEEEEAVERAAPRRAARFLLRLIEFRPFDFGPDDDNDDGRREEKGRGSLETSSGRGTLD